MLVRVIPPPVWYVFAAAMWLFYIRWLRSRPPLPPFAWVGTLLWAIGSTILMLALSAARFGLHLEIITAGCLTVIVGAVLTLTSVIPGPRRRTEKQS